MVFGEEGVSAKEMLDGEDRDDGRGESVRSVSSVEFLAFPRTSTGTHGPAIPMEEELEK